MVGTFSFATAKVIGRKRPRAKRRAASKAPDLSITLDAIAKTIDPDAWVDISTPTIAEALAEIAALRDEIEWLQAIPTTPEQEAKLILSESRAQQRAKAMKGGRKVREQVYPTAKAEQQAQVKRQKAAFKKAKMVMAMCEKVLGRRNTLTIIAGGKRTIYQRSKGGL